MFNFNNSYKIFLKFWFKKIIILKIKVDDDLRKQIEEKDQSNKEKNSSLIKILQRNRTIEQFG